MNDDAKKVRRTYLSLTLFSTFASSFIWGINTLFLLDAGLSITETFAANALFLVGQTVFEVPTGVVADTWGRRASYLIGTITLLVSTLFYLWMWEIKGPFWGWAAASLMLGLGFTVSDQDPASSPGGPQLHVSTRQLGRQLSDVDWWQLAGFF